MDKTGMQAGMTNDWQRRRVGTSLSRTMALAVTMLVATIALAACGGGSDAPATSEPTVAPDPAAVTPAAESTETPVPIAEDPAPSFTFTLFQGQEILGEGPLTPGDLHGKPLVINFWAGLCPPCRAELPDFQEFYEEFGDRVNLVGVDLGQFTGLGSLQDAKDLLEELGITYPAGSTSDNAVMPDYRILGLPATTFIAADGSIFKHWQGALNLNILREQTLAMLGELAPKVVLATGPTLQHQPVPLAGGY